MGLDKSLYEVRGRILGIKPLRSPRNVFFEHREESLEQLMLGCSDLSSTLDVSALDAAKNHLYSFDSTTFVSHVLSQNSKKNP